MADDRMGVVGMLERLLEVDRVPRLVAELEREGRTRMDQGSLCNLQRNHRQKRVVVRMAEENMSLVLGLEGSVFGSQEYLRDVVG